MQNRRKYSNDWYPSIVDMLYRYPKIKTYSDKMHKLYAEGIEKAMEEIKEQFEDSEERFKAFEMIYFKRTHTDDGVSMKLHVSNRTLARWKKDFIQRIAKNIGWIE